MWTSQKSQLPSIATADRGCGVRRLHAIDHVGAQYEEDRRIFGDGPWPYRLGALKRRNLATIIRFTHEQGLTCQLRSVDELFLDA